jgi:ankyrin repeat protein
MREFPSFRTLAAAAAFLFAVPVFAGSYEEALDAARLGDTAALASLLDRGIDTDTVNTAGDTLLIIAVREGHAAAVETILRYRPRLSYRNRVGDSALMLAALHGNEKLVSLLLAKGAPVNHDGWAPLHYAAYNGHLGVLERLLEAGAEVDALTPTRSDVLMLAAYNGHIEVVRRLLRTPIELDRKNDRGYTAEDWARRRNNTDIADLIRAARERRGRARGAVVRD